MPSPSSPPRRRPRSPTRPASVCGATLRAIRRVPGLAGLIVFGTVNNFLGGVLTR
jgi:hypothetical protein